MLPGPENPRTPSWFQGSDPGTVQFLKFVIKTNLLKVHVPVGLGGPAIAQKAQLDELRLDQTRIKPRTHGNVEF